MSSEYHVPAMRFRTLTKRQRAPAMLAQLERAVRLKRDHWRELSDKGRLLLTHCILSAYVDVVTCATRGRSDPLRVDALKLLRRARITREQADAWVAARERLRLSR